METTEELQALQNSAANLKIEGLTVSKWLTNKQGQQSKYFVQYKEQSISPVLNYDRLNHFLLGMHRMKEIADINW